MVAYWLGMISRVIDRLDNDAELEMNLNVNLSRKFNGPVPLPRAGQSFGLVDDETFKRLVWKDADV